MEATLRVLVADDHCVNRILLRTMFESLGCSVETAENGAEALSLSGPFDLVCLDRHMPVMGGEEVTARLSGEAFVVACTSHVGDIGGRFDMLIEKPVDCRAIVAAVAAARTWRLSRNLRFLAPVTVERERRRITAFATAHPDSAAQISQAVQSAAVAAFRFRGGRR